MAKNAAAAVALAKLLSFTARSDSDNNIENQDLADRIGRYYVFNTNTEINNSTNYVF